MIGVIEANPELVVEAASPTLLGSKEMAPMLIVDDASSTPTGLLEILAKSFVERQRISRPNQEQLDGWIEGKRKRKQDC